MSDFKKILITGFALFSLFFGAGNLILPPFLGFVSKTDWIWVTIGFIITAVVIPICGILAHAKIQGTLFDLGKNVSSLFSYTYCFFIYAIAIGIPTPRTASVTHEMAIAPYTSVSPILTSGIYFGLVFIFVMYRSKILDIIGKFLTPLIIIILGVLIITVFFSDQTLLSSESSPISDVIINGVLEGYQTFDAIGGVVVGAVIVVSINLKDASSFENKRKLISKAGLIAGIGLALIYAGLIFTGALLSSNFSEGATRTELLKGISQLTLGDIGNRFLSVLVALACFTTAVGIVAGASDYFKRFFGDSDKAYVLTAVIGCLVGVVVGSYEVEWIIDFAVPTLMIIYPITIVLVFLNLLPQSLISKLLFRLVIATTILFSIPDFLNTLNIPLDLSQVVQYIPFGNTGLGWVTPTIMVLTLMLLYNSKRFSHHS